MGVQIFRVLDPLAESQHKHEVSQADKGLSADAASILKPVVRVNPSYPAQAAEQGIEGWVVLEFGVTSQGTVENIRVIESHPSDVFDEEAKRALAKWRYVPKEREQRTPLNIGCINEIK